MTLITESLPSVPAAPGRTIDRLAGNRWALRVGGALVVMILLAFTRQVSGANDLTSSGTFGAFLRVSVPIGLVGLGAIFAERCGVVNIGLEGMLILGTWFGAWGGWQFGPWWGVLLGVLAGSVGGLVHALATVHFAVNQIVSGVSINILAFGVARYLSVTVYTPETGGGASQSPPVKGSIQKLSIPGISSPLQRLERKNWFLLSDIAGLIRGLTVNVSLLVILAVLLVPFSAWVLWRTVFGLRLRSAGENPGAAESLGVNVYRMKYAGVMISGAFAGLGGAFLVMEGAGIYREGQTGGRGFIGLAALIFGNWRPAGVAAGAALFGFSDALQLRNEAAVHAVLFAVALALLLVAAVTLWRRRTDVVKAAVFAGAGVMLWILYAISDVVPRQFVTILPNVATLLVLAFAAQRLRPPATAGVPYRKGEAH